MGDTQGKKDNNKKKAEKAKQKALKREERKTSNNKGKSLEEMFMYVDEFGQLQSSPVEKSNEEIDLSSIQLGASAIEEEDPRKTGVVSFVSDKGYGFISENKTGENVFFHSTNAQTELKKGNKVSYEKERSQKGFSAINIKLEK